MRRTLPAIAALLIAGPAFADGSISAGNSSFSWDFGQPNEVTQASFNVGGMNHMTASDWMFTFAPLGPAGDLGGTEMISEDYANHQSIFEIRVNGVYGQIFSEITEINANEAVLFQQVTLRNDTQSTMIGTAFHYADFALSGTANDDFATVVDPNNITLVDGDGTHADFSSVGANRFESTLAGLGLGEGLKNGSIFSLSNNAPLLLGDVANAFEWSPLLLLPGQSTQLTTGYHIVTNPVPGPGALALLGLAGLAGTRRRR